MSAFDVLFILVNCNNLRETEVWWKEIYSCAPKFTQSPCWRGWRIHLWLHKCDDVTQRLQTAPQPRTSSCREQGAGRTLTGCWTTFLDRSSSKEFGFLPLVQKFQTLEDVRNHRITQLSLS